MNTKNRLIDKLLGVAKRHKILTYPVLALVALISIFSYFFNWSTGAGKRVVAVVMVMVMLVSQSYFLTSSATDVQDSDTDALALLQEESTDTSNEETPSEETSSKNDSLIDDSVVTDGPSDSDQGENADGTEVAGDIESAGQDNTQTLPAPEGDLPVPTTEAEEADKELDTFDVPSAIANDIQVQVWIGGFAITRSITESGIASYFTPVNNGTSYQISKDFLTIYENTFGDYTAGGCYKCEGWFYDGDYTREIPVGDTFTVTPTSDGLLRVFAALRLQEYSVTVEFKGGADKESIENVEVVGEGVKNKYTDKATDKITFRIPNVNAADTSLDPVASFSLEKVAKIGYKISGATVTVGEAKRTSEDSLAVTLSGKSCDQTVTLIWQNDTYTMYYARSDEPDSTKVPWPVEYDENEGEKFAMASNIGVAKPGFVFKNWRADICDSAGEVKTQWNGLEQGTPIRLNVQNDLYDAYKDGRQAILWPEFTYRGIKMDNRTIDYQYRDPDAKTHTIQGAVYDTTIGTNPDDAEDFTYSIDSVTGGGVSDLESLESTYGIKVSEGEAITVKPIDGGPKLRTEDNDPIILHCKVVDNNIKNEAEREEKAKPFDITINVHKRVINLSDAGIGRLSKVYDNDTVCDVSNVDLPTVVPGIYVHFYTGYYEHAYAGDQWVILTGREGIDYYLKADGTDEDPNNYTLSEDGVWKVMGFISPREVYVTTTVTCKNGRGFVRAGEQENPDVKVVLDEKRNGTEDGTRGLLPGDSLEGLYEYHFVDDHNNERDDEKLRHTEKGQKITYHVKITSKEDKGNPAALCNNYNVIDPNEDDRTFELRLEEPEEITNYIFYDGTKQVYPVDDQWLSGNNITIVPVNDYNEIWVPEENAWRGAMKLTEGNTADGKVAVELQDTTTHTAFTALKWVPVQVDSKGPVFDKVTVTPTEGTGNPGDGFYFPSEGGNVSFGNYYNKTITITVTYYDKLSKPKWLYYQFHDGNLASSTQNPVLFAEDDDDDGYATASFEIPLGLTDKLGFIKVWAEDLAGNESESRTQLTCEGKDGFEWAVEQTPPTLTTDSFEIWSNTTGKNMRPVINSSADSDVYYGNCTAYVGATDETSGIYGVTWYVNGKAIDDRVGKTDKKQTEANFELAMKNHPDIPKSANGLYTLYATVMDNAGNVSSETEKITFKMDDVPPVIELAEDYESKDISASDIRIRFDTYDELSGVETASIYKDGTFYARGVKGDGQEDLRDTKGYILYHYYVDVTEKGNYTIVVMDRAGNEATIDVNLGGISSDMPKCPDVVFIPEINDKGWITSKDAVAQLENVRYTLKDNMEAATYYELWKDNLLMKADHLLPIEESRDLKIPEGIYRLHVWSQSYAGVQCLEAQVDNHFYDLYVDGTAPTISYQLQRGSDNSVTVTFTITDAVEGVEHVSGVDKDTIKVLHGKEPVLISLEELESGDGYTGTFKVTDNGTYTIQAADIAGNVADEEAFSPMSMKINAVKNITESSATVGAKVFKGTYDIKSVSISYRKTTDTVYTQTDAIPVQEASNMAISAVITGLASGTDYVYKVTAVSEGDEVLEYEGYFRTLSAADVGVTVTGVARYADYRDGFISIGLIRGNKYIRAIEMAVGPNTNNIFTFTKVPDGSYNLVATDGEYTKTIRVLVEGGKIIYPETGISLILGYSVSTSVDIKTKDTPDVSAEFNWMDNLLTDEDRLLIENGGSVEYKLTASLIRVTNIETAALSAMYAIAGTNKVVGAYLDLTLYKIVTDENGNVTQKPVSELLNGASVSVTIPLGDMTGKSGLMVVRLHQTGSNYAGRYLPDQDINPSTYTVTTNQFSTYAVLYDKDQKDNQTSGSVNRGDDVINGSHKSSVKKDVAAVEMTAEEIEAGTKTDNKKNTNTSSKTSVGSLRNASTAKTGDETPIAFVGIMMMFAMGGFVVLRKKANKN